MDVTVAPKDYIRAKGGVSRAVGWVYFLDQLKQERLFFFIHVFNVNILPSTDLPATLSALHGAHSRENAAVEITHTHTSIESQSDANCRLNGHPCSRDPPSREISAAPALNQLPAELKTPLRDVKSAPIRS